MKVSIKSSKETIQFGNLPVGAVFEFTGMKFIKISGNEYEAGENTLKQSYRALYLGTMEEIRMDDETKIPANSIFFPKEVIFK